MKYFILLIGLFFIIKTQSQELFVITEPASNMPTGSVGVRMAQSLMKENFENGYNYHLMPEIMWGTNKNMMLHLTAFASNRASKLVVEGGSLYAKYRFFSADDFHSHFRLALYGRLSRNNSDIHQEQIEIMGHNSGFETGIIATQLLNKLAISSSISFEKAIDNGTKNLFPSDQSSTAINYTLSFGKLVYPKKYTNFKQTNINLMIEFAGQTLFQNQKSYLEVVPSIQFIINSQARIDIAYQRELYRSITRTASNGVYIKLEYTFFNVTK